MTRATLPPSLGAAFALAAGELGMFSASHLFCGQLRAAGGVDLVRTLRDQLGPLYPVLDAMAARMETDAALPQPDAGPLLEELVGVRRVVVVGIEALILDALLDRLPERVALGVVIDSTLAGAATRIEANLGDRATLCPIGDVVHWAGVHTALVTAVYGHDGYRAIVCPTWLRLMGPDTRTSFGSIVGFNLLGGMMESYPRWLVETGVDDFTALVSP